nr:DNA-3-methyladenine glycosylase [Neobacillus sp. Marseille-Q6967]
MKNIHFWEDTVPELKLFLPKEFSFIANLNYLTRSSNECLYQIKDGRIYKALSIENDTHLIEIGSNDDKVMTIRFLGDTVSPSKETRTEVADYVRNWFDLDRDIQPFYEMAQSDPLLGQCVKSFYGLRIIGISDLFEAICWGILGQQINLTYAYTLKRRLVEKFGRYVENDGIKYWLFPTPHDLAGLIVEDLVGLGMTVRKSEYLLGVAKLMVIGKLSKELLLNTDNFKKAEKALVDIRGIGPWTANYVLMRCLRMPSAFPIDDVGLHNAIKHLLALNRKPTKDEIRKLAENWAGWESYATFYLWRVLY